MRADANAAAALLDYNVYHSDPGHGRTESRRAQTINAS
jgi:hypothetical protein